MIGEEDVTKEKEVIVLDNNDNEIDLIGEVSSSEDKPEIEVNNVANTSQDSLSVEEASAKFIKENETVEDLLQLADSRIIIGDLAGASLTLLEIEARNPLSEEAKLLSIKLSKAIDKVQV